MLAPKVFARYHIVITKFTYSLLLSIGTPTCVKILLTLQNWTKLKSF